MLVHQIQIFHRRFFAPNDKGAEKNSTFKHLILLVSCSRLTIQLVKFTTKIPSSPEFLFVKNFKSSHMCRNRIVPFKDFPIFSFNNHIMHHVR